jgi:hypothetical protein
VQESRVRESSVIAGRVSVSFHQSIPLKVTTTYPTCFQNVSRFLTREGDERDKDPGAVRLQYEACEGAMYLLETRNREGENLKDSR